MEGEKTVFQKIIDGEIPAEKVHETDKFLAFLDIAPVYLGHTLLIPKEHFVWMQDAPDELISEIFIEAKKLMLAMKKGIPCDYVQIGIVGDEVPHFHIHLIPRYHSVKDSGRKSYENPEQMKEYAEKIRAGLAK